MGDESIDKEPAEIPANFGSNRYTAINDTYLLQVVNFTDFLQLVNKWKQTCQFTKLRQAC